MSVVVILIINQNYSIAFVYALMIHKFIDNVDFDFKESKRKYIY